MKKKWYRLDNAALIFPAIIRRNWNNVFRVSATLTEPVDPDTLNRAIAELLPRFPTCFVRLRTGFFWYYLETITKTPKEDGSADTSVTSHSFVPVFCHYDYNTTQMYFLDDYTDELANIHFITQYGNPFTVDQVRDIWKDITGQNA